MVKRIDVKPNSSEYYRVNVQNLINDVHVALFEGRASHVSQNLSVVSNHVIEDVEFISAAANPKSKAPVKCPYLLHAIFYVLRDEDCMEILGKMSVVNLQRLKQCTDVVKKQPKPEYTDKDSMQGYDISNGVNLYWNVVVAAQDKWAQAIDLCQASQKTKSERKIKTPRVVATTDTSNTISFDETAERMGVSVMQLSKHKNLVLAKHPEYKERVESCFKKVGKHKHLRVECFEEFVSIMGPIKQYKKREPGRVVDDTVAATKAKQKKTVKTKKSQQLGVTVPSQVVNPEFGTGQAAVKALQTYLVELQKTLEAAITAQQEAANCQNAAEVRYNDAKVKSEAAEPQNRADFLNQMLQANNDIIAAKADREKRDAEVNTLKEFVNEATKHLKEETEALEALQVAEQKVKEKQEQIAAFLAANAVLKK